MLKTLGLLFSTRSKYVFAKDKPLHKLACFATALDVLYRIKTNRKRESAVSVFHKIIKEDSVCFDIGAGYGRLTYDIARLARAGKVYSFEPEDYSFQVIKDLRNICRLWHVTAIKNAVFDEKMTIELKIPLKNNGKYAPHMSYLDAQKSDNGVCGFHTERVDTIILDEYCAQNNIDRVDFIKCDIEGGELFVFKGALGTIKKNRPFIFSEVLESNLKHFNLSIADIREFFKELGYDTFIEKNSKFTASELSTGHCDYFFIPREKVKDIAV